LRFFHRIKTHLNVEHRWHFLWWKCWNWHSKHSMKTIMSILTSHGDQDDNLKKSLKLIGILKILWDIFLGESPFVMGHCLIWFHAIQCPLFGSHHSGRTNLCDDRTTQWRLSCLYSNKFDLGPPTKSSCRIPQIAALWKIVLSNRLSNDGAVPLRSLINNSSIGTDSIA